MPQSFYRFYYHIIWSTKQRLPLITPEVESLVANYLPKKIIEYGGQQFILNMVEDHIHLLCSIPPKISVADFVHNIKGSTSHFINANKGEKDFYWQSGYGALTLSEKGLPFVINYIARQKEKHKNNSLIDILEYIPEYKE